eukprot:XP_001692104.1 predicted protein [Chlamydomonas reinhardtii]
MCSWTAPVLNSTTTAVPLRRISRRTWLRKARENRKQANKRMYSRIRDGDGRVLSGTCPARYLSLVCPLHMSAGAQGSALRGGFVGCRQADRKTGRAET